MVEYNAIIRLGSGALNVPFRHGSFSGFGAVSAEYRTSDPAVQFAIEQSEHFRSGRIFILSDKRVELSTATEETDTSEVSDSSDVSDNADASDRPDSTPPSDGAELVEMQIASREDAKQYLVDSFGIKASALRSKEAIHSAAAEHGIRFVGASDL